MEEPIGLKLLLSYDVNPDSLQEYYQFVMGNYVPSLQAMGLQMSEAWQTAYGSGPGRLIGFVCERQEVMDALLENESWLKLNDQLEEYVTDFKFKVVPYKGGFQI